MTAGLRVTDLRKSFPSGTERLEILRGITFRREAGQSLAITGPSGSGKSTLLHLIGTLDQPDGGTVEIDGQDPRALPEPELARFRNETIGFVFQEHLLLPQYTALENVLVPALAFAGHRRKALERASDLLARVGLESRRDHRPAELSGGERQRVAVARALINRPGLLLCDEPTGSLDPSSADAVASLLFELHRAAGNVLVVVTHSLDLARRCDQRLDLREGRCFEA